MNAPMRRPKVSSLISKDAQEAAELRAMCRVYEQADRIFTGQDLKVEVVDHDFVKAPAYSSGLQISFNMPHLGGLKTDDDIIKVTGLNFHELGHIMFTPPDRDQLVQDVRARGQWQAMNALEDQRLETLLSSLYPSTEPYFTMCVMKFLVTNSQTWDRAHALTYGRKFLPQTVRDEFRKRFCKQDVLGDLERIIDKYRRCVFPADSELADRLIDEYHRIISDLPNSHPEDPYGHSSDTRPASDHEPLDGEEQEAAGEWVDYGDQKREEEGDDKYDPESQDGAGEDEGEQDGEGSGKSKSKGKGDKPGGEGDGDAESDSNNGKDGNQDGGKQAGKGGDAPDASGKPITDKDLRGLMNGIIDVATRMPEVRRDVRSKREAVKDHFGRVSNLDQVNFQERSVPADMLFARNGFATELQALWVDADPGYHTHKSSGRVNIARAMQGEPLDTVFDQWDEGKIDANDIDMVILVDISSSMSTVIDRVSQILWVIKSAVEQIRGDVTVIAFNGEAFRMYEKGEQIGNATYRAFGASGGTDPSDAIAAASLVFEASKRTHKIGLFITDGEWWGTYPDSQIKAWNEAGIITACAYLGDAFPGGMTAAQRLRKFHGASVIAGVAQPDGLVQLARGIVTHTMA